MKRYLLVPALLMTLLSGCFTTFGAVAGSFNKKTPAGNDDPYAVARGALIGAVIDAALLALLLSDLNVGLPSEPE